jgi:predicted Zn-dependent protease
MRYTTYKRLGLLAITSGLALLLLATAHAQLFGGEREINRQANVQWRMMKQAIPEALDPRVQRYVECVAWRIIGILDDEWQDRFAWEIVVFEDDSLNAFAMPGGRIGVFTGLLRVADTPDSLAAVIGHEVAHLTEDHVMQRARRARRTEGLAILGSAVTGIHPDLVRTGAAIGLTLPFNREQETEADVVGLQYMARAGFDPRASLELWRNMSGQRQHRQAEFLSTHPADDRRMDNLVRSLTPALIEYNQALEAGRRPNCRL